MTEERGLLARLRRLFGRKPPRPAPRVSRASAAQAPSPFAKPEAQVRYVKERASRRFRNVATGGRRLWLIMGGSAAVLVLASVAAIVVFVWRTTIPEALQGTYRTDDQRYAMRRFELLADQVVFQIGDSASAVERFPVNRVNRGRSTRGTLYTVRYLGDENEPFEFSFTWREGSNEIRLASQPEFAWHRTGPPGPRPMLLPE